jgi:hypothetical protein
MTFDPRRAMLGALAPIVLAAGLGAACAGCSSREVRGTKEQNTSPIPAAGSDQNDPYRQPETELDREREED